MTGLEALEKIRSHNYHIHNKRECLKIIEKELKALEILKLCCIVADYKCENPDDRYELAFCRKICITEEEYKLLEEILNERI